MDRSRRRRGGRRAGAPRGPDRPGVSSAERLTDGRVFVGTIVAADEELAELRPWGCDETIVLLVAEVQSVGPVGPHSWAEMREVKRRQRRGEPALVAKGAR